MSGISSSKAGGSIVSHMLTKVEKSTPWPDLADPIHIVQNKHSNSRILSTLDANNLMDHCNKEPVNFARVCCCKQEGSPNFFIQVF